MHFEDISCFLPLICVFFEPSRRLTLEVDSNVCGGFFRSTSRFLSLDADATFVYCVEECGHLVPIWIAS
jgi:hypothetical protein